MCMSETVKKEKEDFKKLYEGIQNDVVRERIRASGEWYIERATKYKRIFFILSAIGIIAPLLVTVIISAGLNHTDGGSDGSSNRNRSMFGIGILFIYIYGCVKM